MNNSIFSKVGLILLCVLIWVNPARAQDGSRDEAARGSRPSMVDLDPDYRPPVATRGRFVLLYDNGSLVNNPGGGVGGADESVLQSVSLGMTTLGFGHQVSANNHMADDFTVPTGDSWDIDEVTFFAYQTLSGTTSTMTEVRYQIWDGSPNVGTSTIIYGDLVTNKLTSTMWSGIYRASETTTGTAVDRPIMENVASAGLTLGEGTYWIEWYTNGTLSSGPWAPPVTITGMNTTGNALQHIGTTGLWQNANDSGTLTQQGMPFQLWGSAEPPGDPLAQFGVCYGGTGSADITNPGALITIDPATGAGTLVGPSGILGTSIPALTIKSTGEIYTLSATSNSNLYILDASTGAGTFVANTGLNTPDALAFDANDILYAVSNSNNLYTIDVNTGGTTLIGPTGFVTKAMSYDPTDGTMYGSSADDRLYTIDLSTGASTLVGAIGIGGSTHALRFDQDGNLFGTKGSPTTPYTLIAIDKATGEGATVGPVGFTAVLGLASRVLYTPPAQAVTVEVEIDSLLRFVPAEGDTFPYTLTITNHTALTQVVDWWTKVIRPIGDPIDPLSGPHVLVLSRFETALIDTPLLTVPFDARTGDYSLIGFVGRYLTDTLDTDSTDFYKLPGIVCDDIVRFQARCRPGGNVQARIVLTDASHTGDLVEFTIDDVPYETTVGANRIALLSLTGFNVGSHDVELTEPPGCYEPVTVICPAGLAKEGDDFWDEAESWEVPTTTTLLGNYPNPFNPSTTFRYTLSGPVQVTLKVYNMLGQVVRTLVNDYQNEGYYEAFWDGRNESGASVSSGIYIYRMTAGAFAETKRMLLVK